MTAWLPTSPILQFWPSNNDRLPTSLRTPLLKLAALVVCSIERPGFDKPGRHRIQ